MVGLRKKERRERERIQTVVGAGRVGAVLVDLAENVEVALEEEKTEGEGRDSSGNAVISPVGGDVGVVASEHLAGHREVDGVHNGKHSSEGKKVLHGHRRSTAKSENEK